MTEIYPAVTVAGRSAQYCLHARAAYTGGEVTSIVQASSSVDLGEEKTVEIVGGIVSGNIAVSSSMSEYSSYGVCATCSSSTSPAGSGYIELRRADNSTVVGRIGLPVSNSVTFSNVRYIYIYVEGAIACDISPDEYIVSGARSALVINGTCYFNVVG